MALEDYDRLVYSASMIQKWVEKVSMIAPEFKRMKSDELMT
jgi:hypothetical protein